MSHDPRLDDGPRPFAVVTRTRYLWDAAGPRCYACETELAGVDGRASDYQLDGVLWVAFDGGYGMFIDDTADRNTVALCHDCAHELCERLPWVKRLLRPDTSHSHSVLRDWDGHRGCDLPHDPELVAAYRAAARARDDDAATPGA